MVGCEECKDFGIVRASTLSKKAVATRSGKALSVSGFDVEGPGSTWHAQARTSANGELKSPQTLLCSYVHLRSHRPWSKRCTELWILMTVLPKPISNDLLPTLQFPAFPSF